MRVKFNKEIPFCVVPTCEYDEDCDESFIEDNPQFAYAKGKTLFFEEFALWENGELVQDEIKIDTDLNDEEVLRLLQSAYNLSLEKSKVILAQIKQFRADEKHFAEYKIDIFEVGLLHRGPVYWRDGTVTEETPIWCYIPD
jgi:hypothetical protein